MGDVSHPNIHSHAQNCLRSCSCHHPVLPSTMASNPPFQRLLTFFARRSPKPHTITFLDSLRGDLSIGLNFPLALVLALTRHLIFRNTGLLSLTIHVPTVQSRRSLLGGPGRLTLTREGGIHAG